MTPEVRRPGVGIPHVNRGLRDLAKRILSYCDDIAWYAVYIQDVGVLKKPREIERRHRLATLGEQTMSPLSMT
jgi:hypothetical protein